MLKQALKLQEQIQFADWKKEKHAPVIEAPENVQAGEWAQVKVSIGKAVEHPNTTEHHIRWISCFFTPDDEQFTYDLGRFEFNAHGESVDGPDEGPVYTNHEAAFSMRTDKPGTLHALALCNIHGLWESESRIEVE